MGPQTKTEHLIVEEIPRLRRYARSLCGDVDDADDLVQHCLERALDRIGYWRPGTNLRAWLLTIMHNLHVNRVKSKQRESSGRGDVDVETLRETRSDSVTRGLAMRDLAAGLERLSPEHREILLLVGMEQLSYRETAKVLGLSMGTVMSRLHRARRQLAGYLYDDSRATMRRVK